MKHIFIIVKKELKRFFTDKRMLISLFLPAVIIFIAYTLMGNIMNDAFSVDTDYEYQVTIINLPVELKPLVENDQIKIKQINLSIDDAKVKIQNNKLDCCIVFSDDFYNQIGNEKNLPNVLIYYDSTRVESQNIYMYFTESLNAIEASMNKNYFNINNTSDEFDLSKKETRDTMFLTMLLPLLITVMLFASCMGIATESIAGEKERGTIATLLITPVKRSHIALGKVISLSIISLASAVANFLALILSLPNMMGEDMINTSVYNIGTYLLILGIIISILFVFVIVLSIVSSLAKSIKEATAYTMPLTFIIMILGFSTILAPTVTSSFVFAIPVYNCIQCLVEILSLSFNPLHFVITILSNIVVFGIGIYILSKLFNSEKIMFTK